MTCPRRFQPRWFQHVPQVSVRVECWGQVVQLDLGNLPGCQPKPATGSLVQDQIVGDWVLEHDEEEPSHQHTYASDNATCRNGLHLNILAVE